MKAVRNAPGGVQVVDVDEPTGVGVLVRVKAVGICASDLMYLRYGSTQIAGHEFAGVLQDGTPVAVEPIFGCRQCPECEQGSYNRCQRGPTALGMMDPGGMCEWFMAPAHAVMPLPAGLDVRYASLVEPTSVAWHACHMGGVGSGTSVAVVGAGAIGLAAAAGAQHMGAPQVAIEARHPHQHAVRETLGIGTPSGTYDVVVETAGSESGLVRAMELVRPGGTVVSLGVYPADVTWPMRAAFSREVAIRFSLGYCAHDGRREFAEAADLLVARPELTSALVSHRFPLEDAPAAFATAQDRSQGVFRVVVEP